MGLKIQQKCAILKLISILFNFVSVSKLYVVFDGMDSILKMVHGQLLLAKADNCILSNNVMKFICYYFSCWWKFYEKTEIDYGIVLFILLYIFVVKLGLYVNDRI